MRPRVYITQPIAESALARLRKVADVTMNKDSSRILDKQKLIAAVKKSDILFSLLHDTVDRAVLRANPQLKAVTSICFGLMLAVARRMMEGDRLVHKGIFPGSQSNHLAGAWVWGKTVGLIGGKGRIGQAVARRAHGFSMRVLYSGPRRLPGEEERRAGMTYASLNELLKQSDFVSLHPPLNDDTRHMIGDREFKLMKPTAFIVNTARGAIIEEVALVRALKAKEIAGAGLDVFENEPRVARGLLTMPNVVAVPHLGSAVLELREEMANIVVDNVLAVIDGKRPPNIVNPEVLG
jgi:glyoxylate reductase